MLALQAIELKQAHRLDVAVVNELVLKGLVSIDDTARLTAEGERWLVAYRRLGESTE